MLLAYLLGLSAVIAYAVLTPLAKKYQLDLPPFAFIAANSAVLGPLALILSLATERGFSVSTLRAGACLHILVYGLINLVAFVLYLRAVQLMPAANYQLLELCSPVIVFVAAYFLLGERIEARQLIGFAIMSAGFIVAVWPNG